MRTVELNQKKTKEPPETQAHGDAVIVRLRKDVSSVWDHKTGALSECDPRPSYVVVAWEYGLAQAIAFNLQKDYNAETQIIAFEDAGDRHTAWLDILDDFFAKEFGMSILRRIVRIGLADIGKTK